MQESDTVQFKLNMPAALRRRLDEAAEKSGRSVTAEIIARLDKSFEADEEFSNALENIDDLLIRVETLEREMLNVEDALKFRS